MVDEANQPKMMKLTNLLNAALCSPEPGCVNFNLLHNLLSSVLHHLKLEDVEASIEQVNTDEVRNIQLGTYMDPAVPALEDRLSKVESQLAILNSLPDNRQLLGDLYSGSEPKSIKQDTADNQRRVAELWQTVNINRRVDATEEGVSRVSETNLDKNYVDGFTSSDC
ncbi:hypothetical protein CRM22_009404 [Opisthorchis felineus]|uniref:Uncharacterized protein n=1 Tax=Opisthorchis felineus TaxID=147828 RepID=A0A4V3SD02_OPIFE|nr:hypothetical protein CRM22_009404 [Opisthorchis felineus]